MTNPFGGFVHTSPLSSLPHSPCLNLASNCIRDYFGPTVQTVADCLQSRSTGRTFDDSTKNGGGTTLAQLLYCIRLRCRRVLNEERERLVNNLSSLDGHSGSRLKINKARGSEHAGFVVDAAPTRAALIVLLHHSLVTSTLSTDGNYRYTFHHERARLLPRYPKYVEHAKKSIDDNASILVEELLVQGRMRSEDIVKAAVDILLLRSDDSQKEGASNVKNEGEDSGKAKLKEDVIRSFKRLIDGGYVELAPPIHSFGEKTEEAEFDDSNSCVVPGRKRKHDELNIKADDVYSTQNEDRPPPGVEPDDLEIATLLRADASYRHTFPYGAVWRVCPRTFHDVIRAFSLGRLVAERYGDKVQGAGSIVSAALKLQAHRENAPKHTTNISEMERQRLIEERAVFTPDDIMSYLPPPVLQSLKQKAGGARSNLSNMLVALTQFAWPQVVMEVEEASGHPLGGKFEIATRQLVEHLRGRVLHQVVYDDHGAIAARICSILETKGYLEADAIADAAMVPAKDAREILHQLYRANYIVLMNLQQTKQHNPGNAIYLWTVSKSRMFETVVNNVATAIYNLRLRRQHEIEIGKDWIERAKEAGATDENEHELDKENYLKFCLGLERLDNATLQLDETFMVLKDF